MGADGPPLPAAYADSSAAYIDEPLASVVADSWRRGEAPLWNPWNGCGAPLLGNMQSAPLSPLRVPALLAPRSLLAHDLGYLLRLFVAGWFTFLFLRNRDFSRVAACAGAAGFALTGYLTLHLAMHHLSVEVWLPAACFAVDRALSRGTRASLFGLAFIAWAAAVGGNPQSTMLLYGFVGLFALSQATAYGGRALARAAAAFALGALAAAPALLPAIEYIRRAASPHDFRPGLDHFRASALPGAFIPGWCRASAPPGTVSPFAPFPIGFAVAALALLGAARKGARLPTALFAALAGLYLLQAFGAPGVSQAIGNLPLLRETRLHKYGACEFAFAAACLAAAGVQRIGAARARNAAAALVLLAAELVLAIPRTRAARVEPFAPAPYLEFLRMQERPFRTFGVLGALPPNVNAVFGVEDARIHEGLLDARFDLYRRRFLDPNGFAAYFTGSDVGEQTRSDYLAAFAEVSRFLKHALAERAAARTPVPLDLADEGRMRFFDLLNVRYLLFGPNQFEAARALAGRAPARYRIAHDPGGDRKDLLVLENLRAFPRAWLALRAHAAGSPEEASSLLAAADFDPRAGIVVEGPPLAPGAEGGAGSVRIVERTATSSVLLTESSAESYLVVSETFYPGWRATVDGRETPILPADVFLRAVRLSPGSHEVRIAYRPISWTAGLVIGGLGALALLGLFLKRTAQSP